MEILRFSIAAGETKTIERAGNYIELMTVPTTINVRMIGRSGERGESLLGVEAGTFAEGKFSGLEVENPTGTAQALAIMITTGRGGSRKIPGIIDANLDTAAVSNIGNRFIGFGTCGASQDCILLDSVDGVAYAVHQITFSAAKSAEIELRTATGVGDWVATTITPDPGTYFRNVIISAAESTHARKRHGDINRGAFSLGGQKYMARMQAGITNDHQLVWRPSAPLIIQGAAMLGIIANTAGAFTALIEVEELT